MLSERHDTILLDLDETLVHTSPCWNQANRDAVTRVIGDPLTDDEIEQTQQFPLASILLRREFSDCSHDTHRRIELVVQERNSILLELLRSGMATWVDGAEEFLSLLRQKKLKSAIVSNSFRCAFYALDTQLKIRSLIKHAVFWDDMMFGGGKPNPRMIDVACHLVDSDRSRALLVGDHLNDEDVANAAGIPFFLIRGKVTPAALIDRHQPRTFPELTQEILDR